MKFTKNQLRNSKLDQDFWNTLNINKGSQMNKRTFQVWTIAGGQETIVYRNVKTKEEAFEMGKIFKPFWVTSSNEDETSVYVSEYKD